MSLKAVVGLVVLGSGAFMAGILSAHYETFPYPQIVALRRGARGAARGGDRDEGAQIFRAQCARCHGPDAKGGIGPNLTRGDLTADQIEDAVRLGIPGTEMPGSWMPSPSRRALSAYVLSLADPEADAVDPVLADRGREVFEGRECGTCHSVDSPEIRLGPSLQDVGARRSAEFIRTSLVEPSRDLSAGFRPVHVREPDGTAREGFVLSRDPFSVRMRDGDGVLRAYSVETAEVRITDTSPMPSYADVLSGEDLTALVAYLSSLR